MVDEYVAVDLETTGLDYMTNDIIQIAAVHFKDGKVIDSFESLIFTDKIIPLKVTKINGIDNNMLINAPSSLEVMSKFLNFIDDKPLVIHNAPFDMKFILRTLDILSLQYNNNPVIDTLALSKKYFPQTSNHKLVTLIKELNIDANPNHSALNDAKACGFLYEKIKIQSEKEKLTKKFEVARELERDREYESAIKIYLNNLATFE